MKQFDACHGSTAPDPWICAWLERLPSGSRVLDFAAGQGRHARFAADCAHQVIAVDRDEAALGMIPTRIQRVCVDLEEKPWPFALDSFDAVIVSNYLYRPRLDLLCGLIRPTGVLLYQTFALGNERFGRPRNPDFLLRPAELLELAVRNRLRVLEYREAVLGEPPKACLQRLAAQREPVALERWNIPA